MFYCLFSCTCVPVLPLSCVFKRLFLTSSLSVCLSLCPQFTPVSPVFLCQLPVSLCVPCFPDLFPAASWFVLCSLVLLSSFLGFSSLPFSCQLFVACLFVDLYFVFWDFSFLFFCFPAFLKPPELHGCRHTNDKKKRGIIYLIE